MSASHHCSSLWGRLIIRVAIGALGALAIVGSGGGGFGVPGFPDYVDPGSLPPSVIVTPSRITVVRGDTVVFTANAFNAATYQWRRNGVDIAGARSRTYQLAGADLGDDGAQFSIVVTNEHGTATATAVLQVSSIPPVPYDDGDFQPANWTTQSLYPEPVQGGHKVTVSRLDTGGSPDAFMSVSYEMPVGPSAITVVQTSLSATYDPGAQGAIYGIDFSLYCNVSGGESSVRPMFEQAGRRFTTNGSGPCSKVWQAAIRLLTLRANELTQLEGPPCGAGETCPDFSADGAPIRLGFLTGARVAPDQPAATISQGIDNWKVTVWRK